ncbi:hypothetical protein MPSEU_000175700 [Mayamaea pseudoterrestris]|nr:hypothetical protein MPSEU_000175700 [Mayamaea pseudoterrestris]
MSMSQISRQSIWFGLVLVTWRHHDHAAHAFVVRPAPSRQTTTNSWTRTNPVLPSTTLNKDSRLFVFEFFKQRSQEGFQQLNNLAAATAKGKLGQGLVEAAVYTSQTNKAFSEGLAKSRNRLLSNLDTFFGTSWGSLSGNSQEEMLAELEDLLLMADLGTATAQDIIQEVKELVFQKQEEGAKGVSFQRDDLMSIMRGKLIETLTIDEDFGDDTASGEDSQTTQAIQGSSTPTSFPVVWFIMGANGMGKTTTIGKLAHRFRTEGGGSSDNDDDDADTNATSTKVLVAACDTFRAGAVDQLQHWADRAKVEMVGPNDQAKSPAAVLYNALDKAVREQYDVLLVDTSGRLSSNDALTEELKKMKRVIQKRLSIESDDQGKPILNTLVPHETLLVLDAAQGRMALDSAKTWNQEIGLTGLIVTKLDGSARGGSVVAISRDLNLPVKLIGVGEGIEDLRDFEPDRFVDSLLGIGQFGGSGSKKNEGDLLVARLADLRQQRDSRAKVKKDLTPVGSVSMPGPSNNIAADLPDTFTRPSNPNRRKSKKKRSKR